VACLCSCLSCASCSGIRLLCSLKLCLNHSLPASWNASRSPVPYPGLLARSLELTMNLSLTEPALWFNRTPHREVLGRSPSTCPTNMRSRM
jgi:hypothetical protein